MAVGARSRDAATRGACDKSFLQQVRLVDLADGIGYFSGTCSVMNLARSKSSSNVMISGFAMFRRKS
jgi:hypothetical protein